MVIVDGTCTRICPVTVVAGTRPSSRSPRSKVKAVELPTAPTACNSMRSNSPRLVAGSVPARAAMITPGVVLLMADDHEEMRFPPLTARTFTTDGSYVMRRSALYTAAPAGFNVTVTVIGAPGATVTVGRVSVAGSVLAWLFMPLAKLKVINARHASSPGSRARWTRLLPRMV